MTKFSGPGVYQIVSYQAPSLCCNSWGGSLNPEQVKLYPKSPESDNQAWAFAKVVENGEQSEYLILNCRSGYYLTGNSNQSVITNGQSSAKNPKSRWTLQYVQSQGQYDTYYINCVDKSCGQLNVAGSGNQSGTDILSYHVENGENTKFYLDRKSL